MKVKIKMKEGCEDLVPEYMSENASGMDLKSSGYTTYCRKNEMVKVPCGFYIEIPKGYEGQIRPRSSLATLGIVVVNSPGTIDSDYRGEVHVILSNLLNEVVVLERGNRVAQLVICRVERAKVSVVDKLRKTKRDIGGFGSTGK